jgi:pimeloyl-ACP methyl ester carboxylesterase
VSTTQDDSSYPNESFTHEGCRFFHRVQGSGPDVLFIQGTGVHGAGWQPQVDGISSMYRCITFDNRGMGQSQPRGKAPITVKQMADDAWGLLQHLVPHLGKKKVHVVGHSLGGCIALQLALDHPQDIKSLGLFCTAAHGPGLVKMDLQMIARGLRIQVGTKKSRRSAFLEIVLTPEEHGTWDLEETAARLEPFFGHDLGVTPAIAMKQVRAMGKWSVVDRLSQLAPIPTLVCGGGLDLIAKPPLFCSLAQGIPGARLVELDHAAHGVPLTDPPRINALLLEHLDGVEKGQMA